jgi:hypothetical protein
MDKQCLFVLYESFVRVANPWDIKHTTGCLSWCTILRPHPEIHHLLGPFQCAYRANCFTYTTWPRGAYPRTMKNRPRPLFLLHQTLQLALCIWAGSVLLASAIRLPDGEAGFITSENAFPLLQSPMAASFTPLQPTLGNAHGNLRLLNGCSAMETHFMNLSTNIYCADVVYRGSLELGSECCKRGQTIFTHCALQHLEVHFCELVWPTTLRLRRCCS